MKNILLTGGAGFIGSHVAVLLAQRYHVVVLDKLDYCASLRNLGSAPITFVKGDITCADLVHYLLDLHAIDTIIHFAAQTHVDNSFGNSFAFTHNNIMGTHVLLECAKVHGKIERFVHVSTDEVYGEVREGEERMTPTSLVSPTNPYAATKAAAENLVLAYHRSFNLPVIITRGNNVYGPCQFPEKLIPKFVLLLDQDGTIPIHGDGSHRRSFLHVSDVAKAFNLILHKGQIGRIYNIGTDFEATNLQVAHALCALMGKDPARHIAHVEDRPFNDCRYTIDSSVLHALGWRPVVAWEDGLRETIEWYRDPENRRSWNERDVSSAIAQAHPRR